MHLDNNTLGDYIFHGMIKGALRYGIAANDCKIIFTEYTPLIKWHEKLLQTHQWLKIDIYAFTSNAGIC